MKRRILTAVPLAVLVAYIVVQSRPWVFVAAVVLTAEICLFEFSAISRKTGLAGLPKFAYLAAAAICGAQVAALDGAREAVPVTTLLIVILVPTLRLASRDGLKDYLGAVASTLFGVLYIGFGLSWLIRTRFENGATGRLATALLLLMVWVGDIFAFVAGRSVGKRALAPGISPKKTVEGAVGGLAGTVLVAWGFTRWFMKTTGWETILLLALPVAVAGQLGDLIESALKRGAEMKDSGRLLPGHGGMLDRVDSLLLSAPVFWLTGQIWHR
jgi:phosphatidate cytidylyltransferase